MAEQFNTDYQQTPDIEAAVKAALKEKKKKRRKRFFIVLLIIVVLFIAFAAIGGSDDTTSSGGDTSVSTTEAVTLSKEQYIAQCESINYKDLARNPDTYKGKLVKFSGEVIQVMEHSYSNDYRISVTQDEYGYYSSDDIVLLTYTLPEGSPRILEDDIVTFYGVFDGLESYTSIMGSKITIPSVSGEYCDINN